MCDEEWGLRDSGNAKDGIILIREKEGVNGINDTCHFS